MMTSGHVTGLRGRYTSTRPPEPRTCTPPGCLECLSCSHRYPLPPPWCSSVLASVVSSEIINELRHEKTNNVVFEQVQHKQTQTSLYKHERWLGTGIFRFRKKRNCTIRVAKNRKAMIRITVTAKLICAFIFAYENCWLSHDVDHIYNTVLNDNKFCLFALRSNITAVFLCHAGIEVVIP